jgi:BolA protein
MEINQLILSIKEKLKKKILIENIDIEDKTFLHKDHTNHQIGKYHIKLKIESIELKKLSKIDATKKIYNILGNEIKKYIHSIQILIN